jgi:regulator of nonsense transcripts 1
MDSFDNFQSDSASSYGGIGVVDDTSSVYTAATQDNSFSVDFSSISLSEYNGASGKGQTSHSQHNQPSSNLDEDFDAVLDDLKDESAIDLPPHACRQAETFSISPNSSY